MTFDELLRDKRDAIVQRWCDDVLASYAAQAAAAFKRQTDQFANPVGHSAKLATGEIVDALLAGDEAEQVDGPLREIVKIRAVQQFTASQAVGFVFQLKEAVRAELAASVDSAMAAELAQLEARIDRIALAAFDIFVQYREQVYELRVNEVKRRVSWVLKKMGDADPEADPVGADSGAGCGCAEA